MDGIEDWVSHHLSTEDLTLRGPVPCRMVLDFLYSRLYMYSSRLGRTVHVQSTVPSWHGISPHTVPSIASF